MADAHKLTDEAFSEYESEVPTQQSKKSPNSVGQHWPSSPELLQASFTAQDAKSGVSVGGDVSPFLVGLFVGIFVGFSVGCGVDLKVGNGVSPFFVGRPVGLFVGELVGSRV